VFSPNAAKAQAQNLNLQTTLQTFTQPLLPSPPHRIGPNDGTTDVENKNKCVSKNDPRYQEIHKKMAIEQIRRYPQRVTEKIKNLPIKVDDFKLLHEKTKDFFEKNPELVTIIIRPPDLNCRVEQPTNVTLSLPINPTWESNVLRSPANNSPGYSLGFGGGATVTTAGLEGRPFDLVASSVSSASARYPNFPSKSFDSITQQAAYQIFLEGFYYAADGKEKEFGSKLENIPKDLPAANRVTFDTLSFGFQNQTAFLPGLRTETVDLFTPQITLGRSNISLLGGNSDNKTSGFPYYLDLSLTAGQTLSDVRTQQNTNIAGSVAPGWRINNDWCVTLPTVVTTRFYNDVIGGRRDVLFQVGPALSYNKTGSAGPVSFSLTTTFNQNYSTLATASWRGVIIQPTLTIAFNPPISPK
jgi:hypothetical protein